MKNRTQNYTDNNTTADLIKIESDIVLIGKDGNIIKIKVPEPEYSSEIFS